jgi:hypothetical protein
MNGIDEIDFDTMIVNDGKWKVTRARAIRNGRIKI